MSLPGRDEAAPYYFTYIDRITDDDVVAVLESQLHEVPTFLTSISEEKSLYRYAPGKWSIRQVLNHVSDTERAFAFRALWFGRGFSEPLASFDQTIAADAARADDYSWASHVADFREVRGATLTFFRNLPANGWSRQGIASGNTVTVRALAYIIAGHLSHHLAILKGRYF
ncbi:MAG: DinB family protein [Candidatus Acidiferrales bacterium]